MFTLNLTFAKNSGKKHTLKIAGVKETQNPAEVRALMQHIIDNDILYVKGDTIAGIVEATLQKVTETKIVL